jgi:hypothetical protein
MICKFTECKSNQVIGINSEFIVAVFEATEGDFKGKTVLNLINGAVAIEEDLVTVFGQLAAV